MDCQLLKHRLMQKLIIWQTWHDSNDCYVLLLFVLISQRSNVIQQWKCRLCASRFRPGCTAEKVGVPGESLVMKSVQWRARKLCTLIIIDVHWSIFILSSSFVKSLSQRVHGSNRWHWHFEQLNISRLLRLWEQVVRHTDISKCNCII